MNNPITVSTAWNEISDNIINIVCSKFSGNIK